MDRKQAEDLVIKRYKSLLLIANDLLEEGDVDKFFASDSAKKVMVDLIDNLESGAYLSVGFDITVKHRLGKMAEDKGIWESDTKTVEAALKNGFKIPAEAICIEVVVKPKAKVKGVNGKTGNKTFDEILYKRRVYLMEKDLTPKEAKKRYGITDDDFVFNVREFKNSKLLRFQGVLDETNTDAGVGV